MNALTIACCSDRGEMLGRRLKAGEVTRFPGTSTLRDWTQAGFAEGEALLFIGSCQIAVRAIAPFVKSKLTDPAVVAMDETGTYVIPLLSGHIGGANDLAEFLADRIGAQAVLTTATDRRHAFAADSWAAENGFGIVNPEAVKEISAGVLAGEELVLSVRTHHTQEEAARSFQKESMPAHGQNRQTLRLVPRTVAVGAGCRKGVDPEYLEACFWRFVKEHGIEAASVVCIASIDLKREEAALKILAAKQKIPFFTFRADELMKTPGEYASSAFVLQNTGTDNVCERAAVLSCIRLGALTRPSLMVRKTIYDGVTLAAARMDTAVSWRWQNDV